MESTNTSTTYSALHECANASKKLVYSDRELKRLGKRTNFTYQEMKVIYTEFKKCCNKRTPTEGGLSLVQLLGIFGLASSMKYHFSNQLVKLFWIHRNVKGTVEVGFAEFVHVLSKLLRGTIEERLRIVFQLYDHDEKGYIVKKDIQDFLYSLITYFMHIGFTTEDVNSEAFKARTTIAQHPAEEVEEEIQRILLFEATEAILDFHQDDDHELLWCDEFLRWAVGLPGVAEMILGEKLEAT